MLFDTLPPIDRFKGEYKFLSNFEPCEIEYEGAIYPTLEAAFQAAKTLNPKQREKIRTAAGPGLAKWMGRHAVTLRAGWDEIKLGIMKELLMKKFSQGDFWLRLQQTGERELIEGNTWHDVFFGVCICPAHGYGENMLGKLLMEVRKELRQ